MIELIFRILSLSIDMKQEQFKLLKNNYCGEKKKKIS